MWPVPRGVWQPEPGCSLPSCPHPRSLPPLLLSIYLLLALSSPLLWHPSSGLGLGGRARGMGAESLLSAGPRPGQGCPLRPELGAQAQGGRTLTRGYACSCSTGCEVPVMSSCLLQVLISVTSLVFGLQHWVLRVVTEHQFSCLRQ